MQSPALPQHPAWFVHAPFTITEEYNYLLHLLEGGIYLLMLLLTPAFIRGWHLAVAFRGWHLEDGIVAFRGWHLAVFNGGNTVIILVPCCSYL